jgi:hypothetical protein
VGVLALAMLCPPWSYCVLYIALNFFIFFPGRRTQEQSCALHNTQHVAGTVVSGLIVLVPWYCCGSVEVSFVFRRLFFPRSELVRATLSLLLMLYGSLSNNPLRRTLDFSRSNVLFLVHFYVTDFICRNGSHT